MSELIHRLRRELDRLTDPADRAEVVARIAGVLARSGHFDEAKSAIGAIKEHFGRGESGRVTVWKMIAEGLVFHYQDLSPAAMERIGGALVLGRAMQYSAAIAMAASWKAHIEFERSDFAKMVESLELALRHASPAHHDARTRIAMVLANAFMICGDRAQMQAWFIRGREHAVKNGDRVSVEALQYNKAAFATAWARVSRCKGPIESDELTLLRGEVNSARNLQQLAGIAALSGHISLNHARLLMLELNFESAIAEFDRVRKTEPFASHNFHQSYIDLEVQFCEMQLGRSDMSMARAWVELLECFKNLDIDERIVAVWMLESVARSAGLKDEERQLGVELQMLLAQHESECLALRANLQSLTDNVHDNPSSEPTPQVLQ